MRCFRYSYAGDKRFYCNKNNTIVIDFHCHILPGIDDGPSTLDESIQMAKLLSAAGYSTVYCTPHMVKNLYDRSNGVVYRSIKDMQRELYRQGIPLRLLAGREYILDNYFLEYINDLMPLEGTSYLLIEIPSGSYQGMIFESIKAVLNKGLTPMIAHPERCRILTDQQYNKIPKAISIFKRNTIYAKMLLEYSYQHVDLLDWLLNIDCAFQCNAGSLSGNYGRSVQKAAQRFLNNGMYTHFGTDAHNSVFLEKLNINLKHVNTSKSKMYSSLIFESKHTPYSSLC
jgi:protein-tyrosine phosphatase